MATEQQARIIWFSSGFLIGCAATMFFCYSQFGSTGKVPNLSILIGDIRRAKDASEGMAYAIKSRWQAKIISDRDSREGADRYRNLTSHFNGVTASLEAMLSTGYDKQSAATIRDRLSEAEQLYQTFQSWFESLPREKTATQPPDNSKPGSYGAVGGLSDVAPVLGDLTKHFFDGLKEMDKVKRDHLIGMFHEIYFRPWKEITDSRDGER